MTLNIVHEHDPVKIKNLVLMLYGEAGAGKTSLAFTANNPILLAFDEGYYRSKFRRTAVEIDRWDDMRDLDGVVAPYSTIVVDTVGRCLDMMAISIMDRNPKLATSSGSLTLQGYGALKAEFAGWLRRLKAMHKDVVLVAHGKEAQNDDRLILRPDIQGASYQEVFHNSDAVGYLRMEGRKRKLAFDPQDKSVGKNPAELPDIEVPHLATDRDFLGGLIQRIKEYIEAMSEEGQKIVNVVSEWQERIGAAKKPADLTDLVSGANADLEGSAQKQVKALIAERARELELQWDAKAKQFLAKAG